MRTLTRRAMLQLTGASAIAPCDLSTFAHDVEGPDPERREQLLKYLDTTAPSLLRPAVGRFKYPSVAPALPGKEYAASLWDWDTLWTCRGLFAYASARRDEAFRGRVVEHAKGSLLNFLEQQNAAGRLPILMTDRDTDLLRTNAADAPPSANQAKPVFAQLAMLIVRERNDAGWMRPHFDHLLRFYAAWGRHNLDRCGLYVWGNDVAIGNDNDPTTFGRPEFSSANLLLNTLFQQELNEAAELARLLNRSIDADTLAQQATALADRIRTLCWDARDCFFYTVDVQCRDRRAELLPQVKPGMAMRWQTLPLRIQTFTGFLPLWSGAATPDQAAALVQVNWRADDRLQCEHGVRTLSKLESMYSLDFSSNPSNWLGPVWLIANYMVWSGLKRYGFRDEARTLAARTLRLLTNDLARNGSMNEYYHPDTGAPLSHTGFMDWNLLALEMTA